MSTHFDFAVAPRPMGVHGSGLGPALLPLSHSAPSITGLVEAIQTLNARDAFRPRFSAEKWRLVASYLVRQVLRGGDALVRQDEPGRAAFLVESGTLLVHTGGSGCQAEPVALLRAGALVEESALFAEMPCMAQVHALSPCVIWGLGRPRLAELHASHPELAYEFLRAAGVVMRQRMRAKAGASERRTITSEHVHLNPSPSWPSLRFTTASAVGHS
jgi:CRP-like cAMP-binding protein